MDTGTNPFILLAKVTIKPEQIDNYLEIANEVDKAVNDIVKEVNRLRSLSPLWEMAQEGIDISKIEWAEH